MAEHAWIEVTGSTKVVSQRCEVCDVFAFRKDVHDINPACPGPMTVFIRLDGDYSLKVGDIWPDGDYPEVITAQAIADVMKQQGRYSLECDWDLKAEFFVAFGHGPEVRVDV